MPLIGALAELCGAALVGDLDRAERGPVAVHEHGLDVSPVDGRVRLQEHPEEQVPREKLVGADDVDPGVFVLRVGIEYEPLELVLG